MAIGMRRKKRGLFGSAMQAQAAAQAPQEPMQAGLGMEAPQQSGGVDWRALAANVAGSAGDYLAQWGGGSAIYGPQMQQQQAMRQQAAMMAERQRMQSLQNQEWYNRQRFQIENTAPDAFDRSLAAAGIDPSSPEGVSLYRQRAERLAQGQEPFISAPLPGNRTFYGNPSDLPAAMQAGQSAPDTLPPDFFDAAPDVSGLPTNAYPFANGPATMTAEQFRGIIQAKGGRAAAEQWARDNNIQVVN